MKTYSSYATMETYSSETSLKNYYSKASFPLCVHLKDQVMVNEFF